MTARSTLSVSQLRFSSGVMLISAAVPFHRTFPLPVSLPHGLTGPFARCYNRRSGGSTRLGKRGWHAGDQADERTGGDCHPPQHPPASAHARPPEVHPPPPGCGGVGAQPPAHGAGAAPRRGGGRPPALF